MFGFGKQRKREAAKREALAIGARHVELINQRLEEWRAVSIDTRRDLMEQAFAERLVALDASDGLTVEMGAEIEALALMKNWIEQRDGLFVEFVQGLTPDTIDVMAALNMGEAVQEHLHRHFAEASAELEANMNATISEELARRGEPQTPRTS